jgi:peptidoglycan/LPS O-acetylase OafA/YrhL
MLPGQEPIPTCPERRLFAGSTKTAATPHPADRVPELDALRGLSAIAIVVFHCNHRWLPFGWAFVDLFFVLSGYLITAIILKHGEQSGFLRTFYLRRALRVWPLYFLVVGLVAVFTPFLPRWHRWAALPYALTFTQNVPLYWSEHAPAFSPYLLHTWTLSLEEQFYLIWPALILLTGRRRIVTLTIGCAAIALLARVGGVNHTLLLGRCGGLALGGLLAGLLASGRPEGPARTRFLLGLGGAVAAGLALLAGLGVSIGLERTLDGQVCLEWTILGFTLIWLGTVGLAVVESGHPAFAWLRFRGLLWLGRVSYGLYLFHHIFMHLIIDASRISEQKMSRPILLLLTIASTLLAAGLSHAYFEAPILALKSRFGYSRRGSGSRPAHRAPVGRRAGGDGAIRGSMGRAG